MWLHWAHLDNLELPPRFEVHLPSYICKVPLARGHALSAGSRDWGVDPFAGLFCLPQTPRLFPPNFKKP